jgi:putative transposon-encoded protein
MSDILWISMKKKDMHVTTKLVIEGIEGFYIRKVTKFGNSAKVDCPKEHLGKTVYLVIV